jgi:hypothetical protein
MKQCPTDSVAAFCLLASIRDVPLHLLFVIAAHAQEKMPMPFYVLKHQNGEYLSLKGNEWVADLREAAVFTSRSNATNAVRRAWQGLCQIERIVRLPDRIPRTVRGPGWAPDGADTL